MRATYSKRQADGRRHSSTSTGGDDGKGRMVRTMGRQSAVSRSALKPPPAISLVDSASSARVLVHARQNPLPQAQQSESRSPLPPPPRNFLHPSSDLIRLTRPRRHSRRLGASWSRTSFPQQGPPRWTCLHLKPYPQPQRCSLRYTKMANARPRSDQPLYHDQRIDILVLLPVPIATVVNSAGRTSQVVACHLDSSLHVVIVANTVDHLAYTYMALSDFKVSALCAQDPFAVLKQDLEAAHHFRGFQRLLLGRAD
jgi:hypothetical protein